MSTLKTFHTVIIYQEEVTRPIQSNHDFRWAEQAKGIPGLLQVLFWLPLMQQKTEGVSVPLLESLCDVRSPTYFLLLVMIGQHFSLEPDMYMYTYTNAYIANQRIDILESTGRDDVTTK